MYALENVLLVVYNIFKEGVNTKEYFLFYYKVNVSILNILMIDSLGKMKQVSISWWDFKEVNYEKGFV